MKLKIIETPDYILAVSHENKTRGYFYCYRTKQIFTDEGADVNCCNADVAIEAYHPKNNDIGLDLPLLPEIVVKDDAEKLVEIEQLLTNITEWSSFKEHPIGKQAQKSLMLLKSYKSATKVYSEDDLRRAIIMSANSNTDFLPDRCDEIIQSIKNSTPKWFVAEYKTEYTEDGLDYQSDELKTTTINSKTYLVGTYLYE
jgi:hypothetical protein